MERITTPRSGHGAIVTEDFTRYVQPDVLASHAALGDEPRRIMRQDSPVLRLVLENCGDRFSIEPLHSGEDSFCLDGLVAVFAKKPVSAN